MRWLLFTLAPLATGLLGWAGARLEVRSELVALRDDVQKLTTQQEKLVKSLDELTRPATDGFEGGTLPKLSKQVQLATRAAARATAEARGGESERSRAAKIAVGDQFVGVFDTLTEKRGQRADMAYWSLFEKVAVP